MKRLRTPSPASGPIACSGGAAACYPPVVNYTPLYYLINGVAFNRTNSARSLFAASAGSASAPITGNVLVRMVNAGSRMHVPTIVGSTTNANAASGFALIAEDGNRLPGTPRVQNEVFMAAGKTYDVMIDAPAAGGTALPIFDRQGSLSANAIARDAGMLAYISVNGAGVPAAATGGAAAPLAAADTYPAVKAGITLTISDPAKGVIANDTNIYGVQATTQPANGTLTLNANGTFSYVPDAYVGGGNSTTTDTLHLLRQWRDYGSCLRHSDPECFQHRRRRDHTVPGSARREWLHLPIERGHVSRR